jgi:hypothetical protein
MGRLLAPLLASFAVFAPCIAMAAETAETPRPRVTITPRIGLGFPGEATARKISKTKLGVGFVMHHDAMIALGNHFGRGSR